MKIKLILLQLLLIGLAACETEYGEQTLIYTKLKTC